MPVTRHGTLPEDLRGRLDAIFARTEALVSLAAVDRLTGERWELSGDHVFPAAQLAALPLLLTACDRLAGDAHAHAALRPLMMRAVLECDGAAINALSDALDMAGATEVSARELRDLLAAVPDGHPLWDLLAWEGDRTKFPRRLPGVPVAYKAADRCEPALAHAAGRLGGPDGVIVVVLTSGEARTANSVIGRIAKVVWEAHLARREREEKAREALAETRKRLLPDARLGVWQVAPRWEAGRLVIEGETTVPCPRVPCMEAMRKVPHREEDGDLDWGWEVHELRGEAAEVTAPVLNLRKEPRHGSELVSQAPMGTRLDVLKRPEGEWWQVQTLDGYVAWARSDNMRRHEGREGGDSAGGLRTLPVVWMAPVVGEGRELPLAAGTRLSGAVRVEGGWEASTPEGLRVVVAGHAAIAEAERRGLWGAGLGEKAVALAEAWLGVPYLWGGKSGWGLDCSGLTQLAYELLGVLLPRDADQQARALPPVPNWDELRPGDLLFYPGHVAIWAGEGAVVHASSPRGAVVRERVDATPWLRERCSGIGRPGSAS